MSMREVQVLQATKTAPNSRGRNNNYAVQIDRIKVNPDGTKSALQFTDDNNDLNGPVD